MKKTFSALMGLCFVLSAMAQTFSGGTPPVRVNNGATVTGLYDVAIVNLVGGNFEFYEDSYFRFDHNASLFRIAAVGTAKSIGVLGYDQGGAASNTLPLVNHTLVWKSSYGSIAVGTFQTISNTGISSDYDDFQVYWIECANNMVKYRVTIMGGNNMVAMVERWDASKIPAQQKITLTN